MSDNKKNKHAIIEGALAGGLIGAALGAFLTGKSRGALVSALVGAAIGASLKALKEAKNLDMPLLYEENGVVYKLLPNGSREFVKKLDTPQEDIPTSFSLE